MNADFWRKKWTDNVINFHEGTPNDQLVSEFLALGLQDGAHIFVPLCGKTVDMIWLRQQGCIVTGVELSELAVQDFFKENSLNPTQSTSGAHTVYEAEGIRLFVGDAFTLTTDQIGPIDAVYDRAASVALPSDMRRRYIAHVAAITNKAPQLLITLDYDQSIMNGPPFAITDADVAEFYTPTFSTKYRTGRTVDIKGRDVLEKVWHLTG